MSVVFRTPLSQHLLKGGICAKVRDSLDDEGRDSISIVSTRQGLADKITEQCIIEIMTELGAYSAITVPCSCGHVYT